MADLDSEATAHCLLVLDFDGTLCVGDAAALRYAQLTGGDAYVAAVQGFLREGRAADPRFAHAADGWQAVLALAKSDGTATQAAFLRTRGEMADGEVAIEAPDGLADFLAQVRGAGARTLLVTNSPQHGMASCLDRLGVASLLDDAAFDAHKPAGLERVLDEQVRRYGADRILSVGDIWRNDLAPAAARAIGTAYIDRWNLREGEATFAASSFPELYSSILTWIETAAG